MTPSLHARLLARLVDLLGSSEDVCDRLHVPYADFAHWLTERSPMPRAIFLKAVDVLVEEASGPVHAGGEPADEPYPIPTA